MPATRSFHGTPFNRPPSSRAAVSGCGTRLLCGGCGEASRPVARSLRSCRDGALPAGDRHADRCRLTIDGMMRPSSSGATDLIAQATIRRLPLGLGHELLPESHSTLVGPLERWMNVPRPEPYGQSPLSVLAGVDGEARARSCLAQMIDTGLHPVDDSHSPWRTDANLQGRLRYRMFHMVAPPSTNQCSSPRPPDRARRARFECPRGRTFGPQRKIVAPRFPTSSRGQCDPSAVGVAGRLAALTGSAIRADRRNP